MVVFGTIDTTNTAWEVSPEFYVSLGNFYEANELTGQHAIGAPLIIAGQGNIADRIQLSNKFDSRVKILSIITIGLAYYSAQNFVQALEIFQSAGKITGWNDDEGKQILYLLIGNAAGKGRRFSISRKKLSKSVIT